MNLNTIYPLILKDGLRNYKFRNSHLKPVSSVEEGKRGAIFTSIYYPVFRIYPFGIKEDFGHTLIKFKLSRRAAFTIEVEGFQKQFS